MTFRRIHVALTRCTKQSRGFSDAIHDNMQPSSLTSSSNLAVGSGRYARSSASGAFPRFTAPGGTTHAVGCCRTDTMATRRSNSCNLASSCKCQLTEALIEPKEIAVMRLPKENTGNQRGRAWRCGGVVGLRRQCSRMICRCTVLAWTRRSFDGKGKAVTGLIDHHSPSRTSFLESNSPRGGLECTQQTPPSLILFTRIAALCSSSRFDRSQALCHAFSHIDRLGTPNGLQVHERGCTSPRFSRCILLTRY